VEKMSLFENSWESLDKARNVGQYKAQKLENGKDVTFLAGGSNSYENKDVTRQVFTEEQEKNITKAAEKMNDRED